ncbi:hypothetical protein JCM10212_002100, partial [Sporobolomyces blumeae]
LFLKFLAATARIQQRDFRSEKVTSKWEGPAEVAVEDEDAGPVAVLSASEAESETVPPQEAQGNTKETAAVKSDTSATTPSTSAAARVDPSVGATNDGTGESAEAGDSKGKKKGPLARLASSFKKVSGRGSSPKESVGAKGSQTDRSGAD